MVPVKIDQRRAGQRRRFDRHPEKPEMVAHGHECHRGQEEEQATGENRFRGVREQPAFFEIRPVPAGFTSEVPDRVNRGREEQ